MRVKLKLPKPRMYQTERGANKRRDTLAAQFPEKEFYVGAAGFGRYPFAYCVWLAFTCPDTGAKANVPCA